MLYDGKPISIDGGGYYRVYVPNHPHAHKDGYMHVHVLQAEKMLGRMLTDDECVHHRDFNKLNNDFTNLMVFATSAMHAAYHNALKYGNDYTLRRYNGVYYFELGIGKGKSICPQCGRFKSNKAKICLTCLNKIKHQNVPGIVMLRQDILSMNLVQIGKKYGVSDNAVRKWLKYYGLPYSRHDIEVYKKKFD